MSRFWFLRRPLMLVGGLFLLIGAYVGVAAAMSAHQTRERDARFNACLARSEATADAKLPLLTKTLAAAPFPEDLKPGPAFRMRYTFDAGFGPRHTVRPPRASTVEVDKALRLGGFTDVTSQGGKNGWMVTAGTPGGEVSVFVLPSGKGSNVSVLLRPVTTPCASHS